MDNILITGGAGLIGSALAEQLIDAGSRVRVIDDLSTGSIRNIEPVKHHPRYSYVIDTIFNEPLMAELVDEADVIYHLAAAVGVKLIIDDPVGTIETNVKGTEILLNSARKKKKKVLIASTSEVYGKRENAPFSEQDDLIIGPSNKSRWAYACSKLMDEFLALAYHRAYRVPIIIVRLFNTVGPRQTGRYGMVIPRFVEQALKGEDITVYGSGEQSRCFCHVKDVVNALTGLKDRIEAVGQIFNVGSQEEITIKQLAEEVKKLTGTKSNIVYVPYNEAYETGFEDMNRRVPDITKIQKLIGFRPSFSMSDIIHDIVDFKKPQLQGSFAGDIPL